MEKPIIAIDPGVAGGFAWVDSGGITHAESMPAGMTAQADRLRSLAAENNQLNALDALLSGQAAPRYEPKQEDGNSDF